jgi:glutaminyl-tRNA synthetase
MTTPALPTGKPTGASAPATLPSNFLRQIIEGDLATGTYANRRWAGSPGDAAHHASGQPDPAKIRTRFPPEPNGYLHIGHAKSICINFGLARDYGGVCHLRFDDTNPEKEDQEYVDGIIDTVRWLGFEWNGAAHAAPYQASDYFGFMYRAAEHLIEAGLAYVDEQTAEQMRAHRGDFNKPGVDSPFRSRTPAENLARFREMRDGQHEDGSMVLRAKIDMASPNINLRDPAIYRIRRATHHSTGDAWCIYPMYAYAHPIEDALEQITHSLCTLEFEDQRPWYNWLLQRLIEGGLLASPPPHQYEFARLNLTYVVTSKRKLAQLVYDHKVSGWDDPRMPTLVGLRRRGYTPAALQLFAERIGVTKSDSWIDYSTLEGALRETLDVSAPRAMAVLDPIKLVLTNWEELMGKDVLDPCSAPVHPHLPELGKRSFHIGKEVWIERSDYEEVPSKGFFRLYPGNKVRLKYGHVIEVEGANYPEGTTQDAIHSGAASAISIKAKVIKDTKSGTPGSDAIKVKGVITWVAAADAVPAEIRLYDRLFTEAQPDAGGKDFLESLNPNSLKVLQAMVEPSLANAQADDKFQFERHGYFVADRVYHVAGKLVFNLAVGLKDSWGK